MADQKAERGHTDTPNPGLLDSKTAARFLGVSPRTVFNLISSKRLKARRLGRLVKVEQAELDRFIGALPAVESSSTK